MTRLLQLCRAAGLLPALSDGTKAGLYSIEGVRGDGYTEFLQTPYNHRGILLAQLYIHVIMGGSCSSS